MAAARKRRRWLRHVLLALAAAYLIALLYGLFRPLPAGIDYAGPWRPASEVRFLADSTWLDANGHQHTERQIFDAAFAMIERAESLIVSDFFLVNQFAGQASDAHRALSRELIDALAQERLTHPGMHALLITDPFNTLYRGVRQPLFDALRQVHVPIVETRLTRLRDPNPAWSAAWRLCCMWLGNDQDGGWLPNPVDQGKVSLRTLLALLNFKANHRKTLVVHGVSGWEALVTSANPHDASSRHDNIAIAFDGPAAEDLLATERAVVEFSFPGRFQWPELPPARISNRGELEVRVLTESAIRDAALDMLRQAGAGDRIDLLMFYLSHRDLVRALIDARSRGVAVRVLLDPNRDAFGREKNGIPNRQVAWELHRNQVDVRWCNTRGEQCHGKMLVLRSGEGEQQILAGSANFTRRNLDNYNLETNIQVRAADGAPFAQAVNGFFDERWHNTPQRIHSLPYSSFADESRLRYWQYRIMEATGLSTF
ncbi:MAG: phospholipase [Pseudomonadota bacterium]|nr:MAG: phospholipase [Pseudomonadota bacterium]